MVEWSAPLMNMRTWVSIPISATMMKSKKWLKLAKRIPIMTLQIWRSIKIKKQVFRLCPVLSKNLYMVWKRKSLRQIWLITSETRKNRKKKTKMTLARLKCFQQSWTLKIKFLISRGESGEWVRRCHAKATIGSKRYRVAVQETKLLNVILLIWISLRISLGEVYAPQAIMLLEILLKISPWKQFNSVVDRLLVFIIVSESVVIKVSKVYWAWDRGWRLIPIVQSRLALETANKPAFHPSSMKKRYWISET